MNNNLNDYISMLAIAMELYIPNHKGQRLKKNISIIDRQNTVNRAKENLKNTGTRKIKEIVHPLANSKTLRNV